MAYLKFQFGVRQYLVNLLCRCPVGSACNWGRAHCDKPWEHLHRRFFMLFAYLKWMEVSPLFDLTKNFAAVIFLNSCFLKITFCVDCTVHPVFFCCFAQVSKRWNLKTRTACYTKASKTRRGGYWVMELIISVDVLCGETPNGKRQWSLSESSNETLKSVKSGHCLNFIQLPKDSRVFIICLNAP